MATARIGSRDRASTGTEAGGQTGLMNKLVTLRLALMSVLVLPSGCSTLRMDSFEDWEPASSDYLDSLPQDVRSGFADDGHAIAFALSTDCFRDMKPGSDRDRAVRAACDTEDWGLLSDVMTMADLCEYLVADGNNDVATVNGGRICG